MPTPANDARGTSVAEQNPSGTTGTTGAATPPLSRYARYTVATMALLYLAMMLGVSVGREWLAQMVWPPFTLGAIAVIAVHVLPVGLSIAYLRQGRKRAQDAGTGDVS